MMYVHLWINNRSVARPNIQAHSHPGYRTVREVSTCQLAPLAMQTSTFVMMHVCDAAFTWNQAPPAAAALKLIQLDIQLHHP